MIELNLGQQLLIIFCMVTLFCMVMFIIIKDKKFLKLLDRKPFSASCVNFIGTTLHGSKMLDEEQIMYYGLNNFLDSSNIFVNKNPTIKTKFISLVVPLIPLGSQIVFNEEDRFFESKFQAIRVEMYWKQVFAMLSLSYSGIFSILIYFVLNVPILSVVVFVSVVILIILVIRHENYNITETDLAKNNEIKCYLPKEVVSDSMYNNKQIDKSVYESVSDNNQTQQTNWQQKVNQKPDISYPVRQTGIGPSAICSRCGNETSFLRYFAFGGQMLTCAICGFKGKVMKDSIGRDVIM